jgi:hypothetical protein
MIVFRCGEESLHASLPSPHTLVTCLHTNTTESLRIQRHPMHCATITNTKHLILSGLFTKSAHR